MAKPNDMDDAKTPMDQFPKLQKIVKQWTACADCDDSHPKWAEITRGILICLQCSGVHRSLGTHVSQVRSLTLDKWTSSMVDNMCENQTVFNDIWEYHVTKDICKPRHSTNRSIREKFIKCKYVGLVDDYKKTKKLTPAFHKNNCIGNDKKKGKGNVVKKKQCAVYATSEFDDKSDDNYALNDAKHVGMVEYTGVISIHVIGANDLPKADVFSKSDPYVVFDNGHQSVKTKVISNNHNPIWNENLILSVNEKVAIAVTIYDQDDATSDDLLCFTKLDIAKKCKNGVSVKFNKLQMTMHQSYVKQKKHPSLTMEITYQKMDAN